MEKKNEFDGLEVVKILSSYMLRRHIRKISIKVLKETFVGKDVKKAFESLFKKFPVLMEYYISADYMYDKIMMYANFKDSRKNKPINLKNDTRKLVYEDSNEGSLFDFIGKHDISKYIFVKDAFNSREGSYDVSDVPDERPGYNIVLTLDTCNAMFGEHFETTLINSGEMVRIPIKRTGLGNVVPVVSPDGTKCIPITDAFRRIVTYLADDVQIFRRLEPDAQFINYCNFNHYVTLLEKFFKSEMIEMTTFVDVSKLERFLDILDKSVAKIHHSGIPPPRVEDCGLDLDHDTVPFLGAIHKLYPLTEQFYALPTIIEHFPTEYPYPSNISDVERVRNHMHIVLGAMILSESQELLNMFHNQGHCLSFLPSCLLLLDVKKPASVGHNYCCRIESHDVGIMYKRTHPCVLLGENCLKCNFDVGRCKREPEQWEHLKVYQDTMSRHAKRSGRDMNVGLEQMLVGKGFSEYTAEEILEKMEVRKDDDDENDTSEASISSKSLKRRMKKEKQKISLQNKKQELEEGKGKMAELEEKLEKEIAEKQKLEEKCTQLENRLEKLEKDKAAGLESNKEVENIKELEQLEKSDELEKRTLERDDMIEKYNILYGMYNHLKEASTKVLGNNEKLLEGEKSYKAKIQELTLEIQNFEKLESLIDEMEGKLKISENGMDKVVAKKEFDKFMLEDPEIEKVEEARKKLNDYENGVAMYEIVLKKNIGKIKQSRAAKSKEVPKLLNVPEMPEVPKFV